MLDVFSVMLCGFRARYPLVRLDLLHMSTDRQLQGLAASEVDVAFVRPSNSLSLGTIASVHLAWHDRLMVFSPSGHHASACAGSLDLRTLAAEEFVGIRPEVGCGVHDKTIALCNAAGFFPKLSQETNDLRTMLWLVAAGMGVALLPECYVRAGVANVVARPLAGGDVSSSVLMITRPVKRSALVEKFIEFAKGVVTGTGEPHGLAGGAIR